MESGWLKGVKPKRECPVVSYLLYVDDSLFFLNEIKVNLNKLK